MAPDRAVTGIRHIGNALNPCNYVSTPPPYVLDALTDGTYEGGLACFRCSGFRPLSDFELVRA